MLLREKLNNPLLHTSAGLEEAIFRQINNAHEAHRKIYDNDIIIVAVSSWFNQAL